jgi:hypothetical protein
MNLNFAIWPIKTSILPLLRYNHPQFFHSIIFPPLVDISFSIPVSPSFSLYFIIFLWLVGPECYHFKKFQSSSSPCRGVSARSQNDTPWGDRINVIYHNLCPVVWSINIVVSCLYPVKTKIFMPAYWRDSITSGTQFWVDLFGFDAWPFLVFEQWIILPPFLDVRCIVFLHEY